MSNSFIDLFNFIDTHGLCSSLVLLMLFLMAYLLYDWHMCDIIKISHDFNKYLINKFHSSYDEELKKFYFSKYVKHRDDIEFKNFRDNNML